MMKRKRHRITHTHSWSRLPEDDTETPDTDGPTGKYRQTVGVCINEGGVSAGRTRRFLPRVKGPVAHNDHARVSRLLICNQMKTSVLQAAGS